MPEWRLLGVAVVVVADIAAYGVDSAVVVGGVGFVVGSVATVAKDVDAVLLVFVSIAVAGVVAIVAAGSVAMVVVGLVASFVFVVAVGLVANFVLVVVVVVVCLDNLLQGVGLGGFGISVVDSRQNFHAWLRGELYTCHFVGSGILHLSGLPLHAIDRVWVLLAFASFGPVVDFVI